MVQFENPLEYTSASASEFEVSVDTPAVTLIMRVEYVQSYTVNNLKSISQI
jgi:hypothetical protein